MVGCSATYVCASDANQYAKASSREMWGSKAYVSPSATTSWKMFQIALRSASVAGRIFILATNIVGQPLRLPQFQQLSQHKQSSKRSELLLRAPWSTLCRGR